MNIHSNNNME